MPSDLRPRDAEAELEITRLAALAGKVNDHHRESLDAFSEARAWPGGVRVDLDAVRELAEELADARNYAVWGIENLTRRSGWDHQASALRDRLLRCLAAVERAWAELYTEPS